MNRSQIGSVCLAVALLVTGVTFATAPALADGSDEPTLSGVFTGDADGDGSRLERASSAWDSVTAGLGGARARAGFWLSENVDVVDGDETTAADQARALTTYYENHNQTLEAYVNARKNFSSDRTVEITIHRNGETATRYLLANASNGNVTTRVVTSTDRIPDEDLAVCGFAAASAYEELTHFTEEYAESNEDVDAAYVARLKSRYGDDVETSLYPSDGDCSGGDA